MASSNLRRYASSSLYLSMSISPSKFYYSFWWWNTMFSSFMRSFFLGLGIRESTPDKISFMLTLENISISKLPSMINPPSSLFYRLFLNMFSSIVFVLISLYMCTVLVCPMRWLLSWACLSIAGFQSVS